MVDGPPNSWPRIKPLAMLLCTESVGVDSLHLGRFKRGGFQDIRLSQYFLLYMLLNLGLAAVGLDSHALWFNHDPVCRTLFSAVPGEA